MKNEWDVFIFMAQDFLFNLASLKSILSELPGKASKELILMKLRSMLNLLKKMKFPGDWYYVVKLSNYIERMPTLNTLKDFRSMLSYLNMQGFDNILMNTDKSDLEKVEDSKIFAQEELKFRLPLPGSESVFDVVGAGEDEFPLKPEYVIDKEMPSSSKQNIEENPAMSKNYPFYGRKTKY